MKKDPKVAGGILERVSNHVTQNMITALLGIFRNYASIIIHTGSEKIYKDKKNRSEKTIKPKIHEVFIK